MSCNFCNTNSLEHIYTPINSGINLEIYICQNCGLVQSTYDIGVYEDSNKSKTGKFTNLICDAAYSEVRVGKQQMVKYAKQAFDDLNLKFDKSPRILDMKSARGDFALFALDYFNIEYIDCIEEDSYITTAYDNDLRINIHEGKYHTFKGYNYDLIYSCHTLEHYQNPTKYLNWVRDRLTDNGLFYIDVPNIENIDHNYNIDEFFYDKHLFYYDFETLKNYILNIGFELINYNITPQNIGILVKKLNVKGSYINNQYTYNKKLIENYKTNIKQNRDKISKIGQQLNKIFDSNKTNVIFGCGRPLDAFITYGKLDLNNFEFLIDDFLAKITNKIYNLSLVNSSKLPKLDKVLMLIKHPTQELINKLPGNPEIIYLSDLLNNE